MIVIFERRDALGMMFVDASPDEYEAMRRMEGNTGTVIGIAEHIVFNDESRVWPYAEWVEWAATEEKDQRSGKKSRRSTLVLDAETPNRRSVAKQCRRK